jgi:hemolysin activation/secretion protein
MFLASQSPTSCSFPSASALRRAVLAFLAASSAGITLAQNQPANTDLQERSQEQERRVQEQLKIQQERQQSRPDIHLPSPATEQVRRLISGESPCFEIRLLQLSGDTNASFTWLLEYADGRAELSKPDPVQGKCLGALGVQTIIDRLQNTLIALGYTTTRVLAGPQNLQTGTLNLTLVPGRVGAIRWAPESGQRGSRWNVVPASSGDVLNLRDIEQALENYKRVPTAEADIQITPGAEPGSSDLVIAHQQPMPYRLSATADDSGTRSTGKFQGSLTFSYDNWWNLSDLFYVTLLHDLGGEDSGTRGTRGQIVHYSVPFGYWQLGFTQSNNSYHQTVAGANQNYLYSGTSRNFEAKLSRIIHRDAVGKTSLSLKGFQRSSNNYIDDAEVEVQRRVVAGLEWGLNHRRSWSGGSLEANVNYRMGTGAWGSLPAPEEAFGEGTSRMQLWLLDAAVQQSFALAGQPLNYSGSWRSQYNKTPLTPQDHLAIGGRFSVRGFDGLSVLSAERGWLLRNEISSALSPQIQGYVGIDTGRVGGPSATQLAGRSLTGGVLGLRGQLGSSSRIQYEVFIGKPLSKPDHFKTSASTAGFSLSMSL